MKWLPNANNGESFEEDNRPGGRDSAAGRSKLPSLRRVWQAGEPWRQQSWSPACLLPRSETERRLTLGQTS